VEGEGAPPALREPCAPSELRGFEDFGTVFLGFGVRGLSSCRDSPLDGTLFVEELGLMS
jgi:hypothetical protein